jgi:toxin ParE1/3/4
VIFWTEQAVQQLDQTYNYIALANSEQVAERVTAQIVGSVQHLDSFPQAGGQGRVPGTRELVISRTPFIVAYTIAEDHVVVLALYHGARQWPEVF